MIFYEKDWLSYPEAIVDYQTSNESFLAICKTFHEMGVRNALFPLALMNPLLQGVDPFSDSLTDEQKAFIAIEVATNPWYYLREVAMLPSGGSDGIRIMANRAIIAQFWTYLQNIDVFTIQPRQTGKSVGMDLITILDTYFMSYNIDSVVMSKDRELIAKNVARLKKIRDLLPAYLLERSRKDKDIDSFLNYTALKNTVAFIPAQNDPVSAENAGRGFTTTKLKVDEFAHIKYVHKMLPAAAAGMNTAIDNARRAGVSYGRFFACTAGDLTLEHARYAYDTMQSGCPWTEQFYDLRDEKELREVIWKNTGLPNPLVTMQFTHRMLGISDEKMWENINAVKATDDEINKDFFLRWSKGGIGSIVDDRILADINSSVIHPKYVEMTEAGYVMKWYLEKQEIHAYMRDNQLVMGIDTSEQIGRDSTAFVMIDTKTLRVIATMSVGDANIINTTNFLANFLLKYPNVTAIIEKKSTGQTFTDTALIAMRLEGINPFKRFYNLIVDDRAKYQNEWAKLRRNQYLDPEEHRRLFGFTTTGKTREFLFSKILPDATERARHVIYDDSLSTQLSGLKVTRDGRIDHGSRGHDDVVIAWLLANWFIQYGRNLEYYGIDTRRIMMGVSKEGRQMTDEDMSHHLYLEEVKEQAEEILSQLKAHPHPTIADRLKLRLERFNDVLSKNGLTPMSLEGVIREKEDIRKANRVKRQYSL